jgi:hypothetical protein
MPFKRKQPDLDAEDEQNDQLRGNQQQAQGVVLVGGVSCSAASLRAIRKPFKVRPARLAAAPRYMHCLARIHIELCNPSHS